MHAVNAGSRCFYCSFQVLKLLIMAWDRRLIFTIGTSSTTGETDTVVWNEIHHKTEFGSNLTGHGYPDTNYLDNVMRELAAHGVGEDNLKDWGSVHTHTPHTEEFLTAGETFDLSGNNGPRWPRVRDEDMWMMEWSNQYKLL